MSASPLRKERILPTAQEPRAVERPEPLVLDLDRALLRTDLLAESLIAYLRGHAWRAWTVIGWALRGRAHLRRRLAEHAEPDVQRLPVNDELAAYAADQKAAGRDVHLATAAEAALARKVALRFAFVDGVISGEDAPAFRGEAKARALVRRFPEGFAYAGADAADLPVWRECSRIVVVEAPAKVERAVRAIDKPERVFRRPRGGVALHARALRLEQWTKNLLVFVPLVLAGQALEPAAWGLAAAAFLALGLLGSASALVNALWDLPEDRRHWSKRDGPLAGGRMPMTRALAMVPAGIVAGFALGGAAAGPAGAVVLALFLAALLATSARRRRGPIRDAVRIAALASLRLGLGIAVLAA